MYLRRLNPQERALFEEAKVIEWNNVLKLEAVEVVCPREARLIRGDEKLKERILTSRFVHNKKKIGETEDDDSWKAKSRWVILGHTDPDLKFISTFSPVLSRDGFMTCLQLLTSYGFTAQFGDISSAFCSGPA